MRIAKTSGDLYDAYRNLFLAFECLLDDIHPHISGRESDWFKAALAAADSLVPVAQLAPSNEPNPIEWVYQNVYGAERSGLVHAKQGRGYLLPHDTTGRAALASSLENLWRYVRELTSKHLGVTSGGGYLSQHGWALFADPLLQTLKLFVSEDVEPFIDAGSPRALNSASETVEATPTAPVADPADPMLRTITASFDPAQLRQLDIHKLGALETGDAPGVVAASELTGPLRLGEDVSLFELVLGLRNFSANGPPTVFSS